jgi:hypothetical protein
MEFRSRSTRTTWATPIRRRDVTANDLYGAQVMSGLALFDRARRNVETRYASAVEAVATISLQRVCA